MENFKTVIVKSVFDCSKEELIDRVKDSITPVGVSYFRNETFDRTKRMLGAIETITINEDTGYLELELRTFNNLLVPDEKEISNEELIAVVVDNYHSFDITLVKKSDLSEYLMSKDPLSYDLLFTFTPSPNSFTKGELKNAVYKVDKSALGGERSVLVVFYDDFTYDKLGEAMLPEVNTILIGGIMDIKYLNDHTLLGRMSVSQPTKLFALMKDNEKVNIKISLTYLVNEVNDRISMFVDKAVFNVGKSIPKEVTITLGCNFVPKEGVTEESINKYFRGLHKSAIPYHSGVKLYYSGMLLGAITGLSLGDGEVTIDLLPSVQNVKKLLDGKTSTEVMIDDIKFGNPNNILSIGSVTIRTELKKDSQDKRRYEAPLLVDKKPYFDAYKEFTKRQEHVNNCISESLFLELHRIAYGIITCYYKLGGNGKINIDSRTQGIYKNYFVIGNLIYRMSSNEFIPSSPYPIGFIPELKISSDYHERDLNHAAIELLSSNPSLLEELYGLITPKSNESSDFSVIVTGESVCTLADQIYTNFVKARLRTRLDKCEGPGLSTSLGMTTVSEVIHNYTPYSRKMEKSDYDTSAYLSLE